MIGPSTSRPGIAALTVGGLLVAGACLAAQSPAPMPRDRAGDPAAPRGLTPTPPPGPPSAGPRETTPRLPQQARPAAPPPSQQRGHGRLFQPQNLGQLEGPDREAWQRPDQIMDAMGIGDGSVVADLGAGGGWFTVRLAKRVGPNGVVYAEDIQPQMIEAIQRRVQREGLRNVATVLGAADHPSLPREQLDAALMVETFFEVEDRHSLLTNVRAALKPGGRLGIVEYRTDGGGPGPPLDQRLPPTQVIRAAEAAGFRLLRQENFLPYQYLLVFTR
jgi:SAM-dependent methyltransferase